MLRGEPHDVIKLGFCMIKVKVNRMSGFGGLSYRDVSQGAFHWVLLHHSSKRSIDAFAHVTDRRQWYIRQARDQFVKAAHAAHYRSRAAFKLSQLDEHHKFLDGAKCIIDLGAAPGSWSQLVAYKVRRQCPSQGLPRILAVDVLRTK